MFRKLWMTGADGALGKYVTDRLIAEGWEIHAAVHNTKTEEELMQNFHHHINHRVFPYLCDLTDQDSVERFFTTVEWRMALYISPVDLLQTKILAQHHLMILIIFFV